MNKKVDFSHLGGFPYTQELFAFMQDSYRLTTQALAQAFGNKIILYGVEDQGASYSDGWVIIDGMPMPFIGGAKAGNIVVEEITDTEVFGDGVLQTVYSTKRAKPGNIDGYPYSAFRRFKTDALTINDSDVLASARSVKKLYDHLLSMLAFESTIILKGCEVSNVNTGASTLDIAAGVVMIDNAIVSTPAYSGAYPCYIKPDGTFATVQPLAANYIKFDPYTSQRYADVLKRATTPVGEIKTFKVLSDRFDNAGLGKWEMLGFKICDDLQSRVPLGYDRRTVDPADNAWDTTHTVVGAVGGEKRHTLTIAEMPEHDHDLPVEGGGGVDRQSLVTNPNADERLSSFDKTGKAGGDTPHENRQPFRVVVFAERI